MKINLEEIARIKKAESDTVVLQLGPHLHKKDVNDPDVTAFVWSKNYYEWYFSIARWLCPDVILEIGVRFGYSGMAMLMGASEAVYIGFDNECGEPESNDYARSHLAYFAKGPLYVSPLDTQKADRLPYPSDRGPADLIHVDGRHTPLGLYHDLDLVYMFWDPGGVILIDDVEADRALYGAAVIWASNHDLSYAVLSTFKGLMLIWKEP